MPDAAIVLPPPASWSDRSAAARILVGVIAEELELSRDPERRAELAALQIKSVVLSVEARKHAIVEDLTRAAAHDTTSSRRSA
ncbi:hypothetical protein DB32_005772 [Sandaracinus amylolyticus]|uniref:Uncharacterized protein n=1 Tax=Sandaracinus amylolyticus TaxID=927083 RepID=A0A0F6W6G7_9BACT|nr:hypothetical protein DB32_005772 [Sandaracinus amylolyticus]